MLPKWEAHTRNGNQCLQFDIGPFLLDFLERTVASVPLIEQSLIMWAFAVHITSFGGGEGGWKHLQFLRINANQQVVNIIDFDG